MQDCSEHDQRWVLTCVGFKEGPGYEARDYPAPADSDSTPTHVITFVLLNNYVDLHTLPFKNFTLLHTFKYAHTFVPSTNYFFSW